MSGVFSVVIIKSSKKRSIKDRHFAQYKLKSQLLKAIFCKDVIKLFVEIALKSCNGWKLSIKDAECPQDGYLF